MFDHRATYVGIEPAPGWRQMVWAVALFGAGALGAFAGGLGLGYLAKRTGAPGADWVVLGVIAGAVVVGLVVLYAGFVRRFGWGWRELGFCRPEHSLLHLLWWVPVTLVLGATGAMVIGTSQGLDPGDAGPGTDGFHLGFAAGVVIVLGTVVVIPFFEEIVFRRVLMDWLNTALPAWLAAVLVTVVFTLAHVVPVVMTYVFFLGVSLILARLWFKSLWGSFLVHAANNLVVTLLALSAM